MKRIYVVDWSVQWPEVFALNAVSDLEDRVRWFGENDRINHREHITAHIATDLPDATMVRTTHTFVKSEIVEEGAATLVRELVVRHGESEGAVW